jgi:hypothetical protein
MRWKYWLRFIMTDGCGREGVVDGCSSQVCVNVYICKHNKSNIVHFIQFWNKTFPNFEESKNEPEGCAMGATILRSTREKHKKRASTNLHGIA